MKTLRPIAALLISAVTLLTGPENVWSQPQSTSVSQTDAQVSGTLPNSRAGLMTLDSLGGLNEMTIGALPSAGVSGTSETTTGEKTFTQSTPSCHGIQIRERITSSRRLASR